MPILNTKETAQRKIEQLMTRFDEQKPSYLDPSYNETQTRRDFIDPFFKALGWDIDNENNYAESYREVIHEYRHKDGKSNRSPDYAFRLHGGKNLFFIEAKKPSVLIKENFEPAYQVRRYGWSAKLPISMVTDFQELAIYDCTKKPLITDSAYTARIKYITYTDYLKDFDFIWDTFSRDRVLQGGFDRFIKDDSLKKGSSTPDKEFLQSLDSWRTQLAVSICKSNKHLDEDEINFVVQQIIDRIIFLRIAEDRSIEPYGSLQNCIKEGNLYNNLFELFAQADSKYNSGLFDFNKDKISSSIEVENKVLKTIINDLYYPSPYAFSVMPVEILGTAYEQFLGKQIKVDTAHKIKIEEKPAVRKSGGVYYTPQYIVDYIVKNTVGKLVEGKSAKEIEKIKIVDPACGSGSFLLGAYEYLLNYHKDLYTKKGTIARGTKSDTLTPEGNLTTNEKKRILLNNIYGVDIDTNAVEVTKLSLLIKCMEGETPASIAHQMRIFHDRVLPTLDDNIKSGNSLIDTDYYDNELDFGDEKKIKPFNWQKNFPKVFEQGGFDAVIGNPPYVQPNILDKASSKYLHIHFKANMDLYSIFIERSLSILKNKGQFGFIIPSLFIKGLRYAPLRKIINLRCSNVHIKEYGDGVFENVQMPTCVMFFNNSSEDKLVDFFTSKKQKLFNKISTIPFEKIAVTRRGLEIGKDKLSDKGIKECITGSQMERFSIKDVKFISKDILKTFAKNEDIFKDSKLIVRETGDRFYSTIDYEGVLTTRSIYNSKLINKDYTYEFILGLINSSLFYLYFKEFIAPDTKVFPKIRIAQLNQLPIPTTPDKRVCDQIEKEVKTILASKETLRKTNLQSQSDILKQRINYSEEKINKLVYQLYDLTKEEIKTIEESFKN